MGPDTEYECTTKPNSAASALTAGLGGEDWYDAEIAPALRDLAKKCHERGMSFVAAVEYEPGERGGTYYLTEDAGLEMQMLRICALTVPNVDAYVINLKRHAHRLGIDTSASWVLAA